MMVLASASLYFAILVSARASDTCTTDETSLLQGAGWKNQKDVVRRRVATPLLREVQPPDMPAFTDPDESTAAPNEPNDGKFMRRVMLDELTYGDIGGKCLGPQTPWVGSDYANPMAGYYYGRGTSNLWIIFLQGGGYCAGQDDCDGYYTGNKLTRFQYETKPGVGLLESDNMDLDEDFRNAHRVFVPYCTGDLHLGQVVTPSDGCEDNNPDNCCEETYRNLTNPTADCFNQGGLYYSGHLNLKNILHHIFSNQPDSRDMTQVLFSGSSAGGAGVIGQCDWLKTMLSGGSRSLIGELGMPPVQVSCAPVAGFFQTGYADDHVDEMQGPSLYHHWSGYYKPGPPQSPNQLPRETSLEEEKAISIAKVRTYDQYLEPRCSRAYSGEEWRCSSMTVVRPFIRPRMHITQNKFDLLGAANRDLTWLHPCTSRKGPEYLAYLGHAMQATLKAQHALKEEDGLWLASCADHTDNLKHSSADSETLVQGISSLQAVTDWFFQRGNPDREIIDDCVRSDGSGLELPCNPMCGNDYAGRPSNQDTTCLCEGECGWPLPSSVDS